MACSGRTVCGQSDHTALLQQHLQAWEHDYYELLGSRGLRGGPPMEHVYQVLQQHLQEIIPEGSPGALLFYHHAQDTLHCWLIRPKHLPLHSAQKAEAWRFVEWQEGLLSGLNVYSGQRGARTQSLQTQATTSRQLILKQLTDVLLPHALRPALDSLKHLLIIPALNISALPLFYLPSAGCMRWRKPLTKQITKPDTQYAGNPNRVLCYPGIQPFRPTQIQVSTHCPAQRTK